MVEKSKSTGKAKDNLEIVPDAWARFERAVDTVIKSGPQHRTANRQAKVAREPKPSKESKDGR